jgi:FAD:protein FMN transferase
LSACSSNKDRIFKKTRILMDTAVTITVVAGAEKDAEKAIDSAFTEIERISRLSDFYSPGSEISLINKNAGISGVKVSSDVLQLIAGAVYVSEITGGTFDITVAPVSALYDFRRKVKPGEDALRRKLSLVGYRDVIIDSEASTVFLKKKGMLIDPGGITKGYTADRAVEILKKEGIEAGIIAVAGDIRTFGSRPDAKPWNIGIRNPRAKSPDEDIMATIELTDAAISTSGDYERFFLSDDVRYHHILDPATGRPAGQCMSVSIISDEAAFTDALSTGIFIMGPEQGMIALQKLKIDGIIVDKRGSIHLTTGVRGKIAFKHSP